VKEELEDTKGIIIIRISK